MRFLQACAVVAAILILSGSQLHAFSWNTLFDRAQAVSLAEAQQQVEQSPDDVSDLFVLGLKYIDDHREQEALPVFEKMQNAADAPDQRLAARWGQAEALRRMHDYRKSAELVNEVLQEAPGFVPAQLTQAAIFYGEEKYQESIDLAEKVLKEPNVDRTNQVRAHLLIAAAQGDMAEESLIINKAQLATSAKGHLEKAQELQPDNPLVLLGWGSFYMLAPSFMGGDVNKAEESLKQAIELDPKLADAYARLAQLYRRQGKESEYRQYLQKALSIDPDNELANKLQGAS